MIEAEPKHSGKNQHWMVSRLKGQNLYDNRDQNKNRTLLHADLQFTLSNMQYITVGIQYWELWQEFQWLITVITVSRNKSPAGEIHLSNDIPFIASNQWQGRKRLKAHKTHFSMLITTPRQWDLSMQRLAAKTLLGWTSPRKSLNYWDLYLVVCSW